MQQESVEELGFIVGANIRHFRLMKNLRQSDLAVLSGITKTTVSNIECGLVWPEYETLKAIMNSLGMLPSDLTSQAFRRQEETLEVAEPAGNKRSRRLENLTYSNMTGKHH